MNTLSGRFGSPISNVNFERILGNIFDLLKNNDIKAATELFYSSGILTSLEAKIYKDDRMDSLFTLLRKLPVNIVTLETRKDFAGFLCRKDGRALKSVKDKLQEEYFILLERLYKENLRQEPGEGSADSHEQSLKDLADEIVDFVEYHVDPAKPGQGRFPRGIPAAPADARAGSLWTQIVQQRIKDYGAQAEDLYKEVRHLNSGHAIAQSAARLASSTQRRAGVEHSYP